MPRFDRSTLAVHALVLSCSALLACGGEAGSTGDTSGTGGTAGSAGGGGTAGTGTGGGGTGGSAGTAGTGGSTSGGPCSPSMLQIWEEGSPLPEPRESHTVTRIAGQVFVAGGWNGGKALASVVHQAFGPADEPWVATSPLPAPREHHGAAATDTHLYVAGGDDGAAVHAEVLAAPYAQADGLEAWQSIGALPAPRVGLGLAFAQGHLYAIGGTASFGGTPQSTVWMAEVQGDGSLSAWTATAPLPAGLDFVTAVSDTQQLYVVGGSAAFGATAAVLRASIAADGAVTEWITETSLPAPSFGHGAVIAEGWLYVLGGLSDQTPLASVLGARITAGGTLDPFQQAPASLPKARFALGAVDHTGVVVAIGGLSSFGSPPLDSVLVGWHCAFP